MLEGCRDKVLNVRSKHFENKQNINKNESKALKPKAQNTKNRIDNQNQTHVASCIKQRPVEQLTFRNNSPTSTQGTSICLKTKCRCWCLVPIWMTSVKEDCHRDPKKQQELPSSKHNIHLKENKSFFWTQILVNMDQ